jgi:hypothetical protein
MIEPYSESQPSPRVTFTRLLKEYAAANPELSTGDVAGAVALEFLKSDRETLENYFISEGLAILSFNLRTSIVKTRAGFYQTIDLQAEDKPESTPVPRKASVFAQIKAWREFDPGLNQGRLLLDFDKEALERSAEYDTAHATHFAWKADFKRLLADGLPDNVTTVEQFYSPETLLAILEESKQNTKRELLSGTLRLKLKERV